MRWGLSFAVLTCLLISFATSESDVLLYLAKVNFNQDYRQCMHNGTLSKYVHSVAKELIQSANQRAMVLDVAHEYREEIDILLLRVHVQLFELLLPPDDYFKLSKVLSKVPPYWKVSVASLEHDSEGPIKFSIALEDVGGKKKNHKSQDIEWTKLALSEVALNWETTEWPREAGGLRLLDIEMQPKPEYAEIQYPETWPTAAYFAFKLKSQRKNYANIHLVEYPENFADMSGNRLQIQMLASIMDCKFLLDTYSESGYSPLVVEYCRLVQQDINPTDGMITRKMDLKIRARGDAQYVLSRKRPEAYLTTLLEPSASCQHTIRVKPNKPSYEASTVTGLEDKIVLVVSKTGISDDVDEIEVDALCDVIEQRLKIAEIRIDRCIPKEFKRYEPVEIYIIMPLPQDDLWTVPLKIATRLNVWQHKCEYNVQYRNQLKSGDASDFAKMIQFEYRERRGVIPYGVEELTEQLADEDVEFMSIEKISQAHEAWRRNLLTLKTEQEDAELSPEQHQRQAATPLPEEITIDGQIFEVDPDAVVHGIVGDAHGTKVYLPELLYERLRPSYEIGKAAYNEYMRALEVVNEQVAKHEVLEAAADTARARILTPMDYVVLEIDGEEFATPIANANKETFIIKDDQIYSFDLKAIIMANGEENEIAKYEYENFKSRLEMALVERANAAKVATHTLEKWNAARRVSDDKASENARIVKRLRMDKEYRKYTRRILRREAHLASRDSGSRPDSTCDLEGEGELAVQIKKEN